MLARPRAALADSAPWTRWLLAAMSGTLLLVVTAGTLPVLASDAATRFQEFASCSIFFAAAALCAMKGEVAGDERAAWRAFALALAVWGCGALYFAVVLWDRIPVPLPSPADAFWLAFYVPACFGLYRLLRVRSGSFGKGVSLDAVVGGLGVGGAAAALVFGVILDRKGDAAAATVTNLIYPVGDLGLLALVAGAITILGWRASGVWRWIAAAFVTFAVADCIYAVQIAGSSTLGGVANLGWPLTAVILGFAAWRPEQRVPLVERTRISFAIPVIFGLVGLGVLVADHFVRTNLVALGLASASILAMLIRLHMTVRDNAEMLAHSRDEAATDALTGLGNRRKLRADLAERLEILDPEHPLMLTLFDLDGFKRYNDSFGHVAGDELLERISARLRVALTGRGTAYRIGGDEFCALWNMSHVGDASVATLEAVSALSEHGDGFSIGCSYGSVLFPSEATDATDALRIADRRMYLRKGSRRESAGRQSSDVLLRALAERDTDLGEHLDGVADLACQTAARLGLSEEDRDAVRETALLHDVGKVAIPDEILRKPGPLDPSERAFMERHTIIGERIIAAAPALGGVARLVRATHEHFDGRGYPDGLAGEAIPLISRIVAVCDAYDAMATNRPYRAACKPAAAIAELRRCAGTQFDPQVVEAFVAALSGTPAAEPGAVHLASPFAAAAAPVRITRAGRQPLPSAAPE